MPDKIKVDWLVIIFFKAEYRLSEYTEEINKEFDNIGYDSNIKVIRLYETPIDNSNKIFDSKLEHLTKDLWKKKWEKINLEFPRTDTSYEKWEKVLNYIFGIYTPKRKAFFVYTHGKGLSIQKLKKRFDKSLKFEEASFLNETAIHSKNDLFDFLEQQLDINFYDKSTIPELVCAKVQQFYIFELVNLFNTYVTGKVDILMINACFMQMFENCYLLKDKVDTFICPPTLIDYRYVHIDRFISIINVKRNNYSREIAKSIIATTRSLYINDVNEIFKNYVITAIDLSLITSINNYFTGLLKNIFLESNFPSIKLISDNSKVLYRNKVATVDLLKMIQNILNYNIKEYEALEELLSNSIIDSFVGKFLPDEEHKVIKLGILFPKSIKEYGGYFPKHSENFCTLINHYEEYGENFIWDDKLMEYIKWEQIPR